VAAAGKSDLAAPPPATDLVGTPGARQRRLVTQANVVATAVLALATGAVALLFQLAPWLKPDPRDRVGADVSIFALEPRVALGDWIERAFPPDEQAELARQYPDRSAPGEMLYVRTAVDGHKHRDVSIRYAIYHAANHTRVDPQSVDAPPLRPFDLSSPSERSVQALWVPDLSYEPDALFIRVELWDDEGMLAIADSPRIEKGRFAR
jgi:hypothetical protein